MIIALGEWVLNQACREAVHWPAHVKIAVNLSPMQFRVRGLVDTVRTALAATGLDPKRLELEVTESVLIQDEEAVKATVETLQRMGVRIALDDFGTGFSSLGYLQQFSFDKLKIDRGFTKNSHDPKNLIIIRSIVTLSKQLGMRVTVEGVETEAQRDTLAALGCDDAQGWLYCKALPGLQVRPKLESETFSQALAA